MSIFKAYDIRGVYPDELTVDIARKVGFAMVKITGAQTIAVGRDMRVSGVDLFSAICEGIAAAGAAVVDVGLVSTPLFYFSVIHYDAHDAGIMVTASHNPAQYNGFKMLHGNGAPIGRGSGMEDIEKAVEDLYDWIPASAGMTGGVNELFVTKIDPIEDYKIALFEKVAPQDIAPLRVVVDAGNGMGGYVAPKLFSALSTVLTPMFFELDGTFPNHEANPIKAENVKDLQEMVLKTHADVGIAYDGDADRVAFCDERGDMIQGGLATALLGQELLKDFPGALMLGDLRQSKAVGELIREAGGQYELTPVGHSLIKKQMRENGALFAGELVGHYYFSAFNNLDISDYAMLLMLRLISREGRPLSRIVADVKRYEHSGEINFEVEDTQAVLDRLRAVYKGGSEQFYDFDGILCDMGDWWFGVRASNTEPVLRLNMEAKTVEELEKYKMEIIRLIQS